MKECSLFFETLATELKTNIIAELKERPHSVNELSACLGQERSKVSHALRTLNDCRFVNYRKDGKRRVYSLNKETIVPLLNLVDKHVKKYCKLCGKIKQVNKND